mmetsp:Transcript_2392/g.5367  ORF Transcript_2392/g.5367 Transcript_2392/m.5367 type:complete len:313 (-) Transcript_2392:12-950(-)
MFWDLEMEIVVVFFVCLLGLHFDAVLACNQHCSGHIEEQPVLNHADHVDHLLCCFVCIRNRFFKVQVDNVVIVISDVRFLAVHAQLCVAPSKAGRIFQALQRVLVAKWCDFYRHGSAHTQSGHQFGVVDNDNEFLGLHLYHFLSKQRSSAPFNQVEIIIHLIGAVDRDIQNWVSIQRNQWNIKRLCLFFRTDRGWNCDDVLEFTRLELLTQPLHRKVCSRSSSKTDHHTRCHVIIHRLIPDVFLQLLHVRHHTNRAPPPPRLHLHSTVLSPRKHPHRAAHRRHRCRGNLALCDYPARAPHKSSRIHLPRQTP